MGGGGPGDGSSRPGPPHTQESLSLCGVGGSPWSPAPWGHTWGLRATLRPARKGSLQVTGAGAETSPSPPCLPHPCRSHLASCPQNPPWGGAGAGDLRPELGVCVGRGWIFRALACSLPACSLQTHLSKPCVRPHTQPGLSGERRTRVRRPSGPSGTESLGHSPQLAWACGWKPLGPPQTLCSVSRCLGGVSP